MALISHFDIKTIITAKLCSPFSFFINIYHSREETKQMERDTISLYLTLELTKSATPEEIKKV